MVDRIFGGSAWESNPPGTFLAPHTGFEVQKILKNDSPPFSTNK